MAHFLLSAETSFSAAHRLPGVDMCERAHAQLARVAPAAKLEEVEVWETPTYRVVYRPS